MKRYIPFGVVVVILTILFGTAYGIGQQILRLSANDPQIQLAHEVATQLDQGARAEDVVGAYKVNLAQSLASFVVVYDKSGNPVAGTGYLDGTRPKIPVGVLKAADNHGDNRVTWQPKDGVRIASVSVSAKNYYVLAGRSLREVESREQKIFQIALSGWVASLLITIMAFIAREQYKSHLL
ncbi:MAG: hypothetical protein ABIO22_01495 [Candidatus Saccharimonadales bacterium]